MFWQAGALFFFADRASRHASLGRAQQRVSRMRDGSESAAHGGRNFGRGVAGKPAVNRDNQQLLDSSRSRAHSAGSRVNQARNRLNPHSLIEAPRLAVRMGMMQAGGTQARTLAGHG